LNSPKLSATLDAQHSKTLNMTKTQSTVGCIAAGISNLSYVWQQFCFVHMVDSAKIIKEYAR